MAKGKTTSMRFEPQLASRLEREAKRLHRGKNAIISEALEQYLDAVDRNRVQQQLVEECQLLAAENSQAATWELLEDDDGWVWEDD